MKTTGDPLVITVDTHAHTQMVNITALIAAEIPAGFNGLCCAFCAHTTAGITINENADPDVVHDLLAELNRLVPWSNPDFRHGEGNSAAHVKATLTGATVTVPVSAGKLQLGVWQGIFFCEFDGPKNRHVKLQFVRAAGNAQP